MSSLAAAKADNFYYPPDFDPKKHQTLNKYNGQHPLRERASKLDQGILVIRFEIPFNIWCDKCGEHIAKGERFNAEKKAIGQYHSTKILQFTMTHHCGCKITIQTDPKRAEYLVVEGARKKEESYSAADAEVIELPDDAERERRERDPLYRLEYRQGAKAKAMSAAERLAAVHDAVDARTADPYSLNRAMRAALRGEKRAAAAADARRQELGLPEGVALLAPSDGDALAAQVAFLTSSARASAGAEAHRKRILEQDIFAAGAHSAPAQDRPASGGPLPAPPPKRPALGPVKVRAAAAPAESGQAQPRTAGEQPGDPAQQQQQQEHQRQRQQQQESAAEGRTAAQDPLPAAGGPAGESSGSRQQQQQPPQHKSGAIAGATTGGSNSPRSAGGGASSTTTAPGGSGSGNGAGGGSVSGRPPPGTAALAAAAARAAAAAQVRRSTTAKPAGLSGGAGGLRGPSAVPAVGRSLGSMPGVNGGGGGIGGLGYGGVVPGAQKRSNKDRAAEMQKRRQGLGGVGLTLSRPEL